MAEATMSVKKQEPIETKIGMTVKISPVGAGTIMIGGGGPFFNGDIVGLVPGQLYVYSAWPSTGYKFVSFNGFFGSVENGVSVKTPSADTWIQANFKAISATPTFADLTIVTTTGGTVSRSPSGTAGGGGTYYRYPINTVVTLTANPSSGYKFSHWANSQDQVVLKDIWQISLTMNENLYIKAVFVESAPASLFSGLSVTPYNTNQQVISSIYAGTPIIVAHSYYHIGTAENCVKEIILAKSNGYALIPVESYDYTFRQPADASKAKYGDSDTMPTSKFSAGDKIYIIFRIYNSGDDKTGIVYPGVIQVVEPPSSSTPTQPEEPEEPEPETPAPVKYLVTWADGSKSCLTAYELAQIYNSGAPILSVVAGGC
jgi:hypothetical protein